MIVANYDRRSSRLCVVKQVSVVLALGCALAACGKKEDAAPATDATPAPAATAPAVTAQNAVSAKVSALTVDQLREAARKAYVENRLYAPAEDNAVEYYLALREKAPADAVASSALTDLLPMTVIATEQSVGREDFVEAQRLAALIERADAQHPALARLKASITAAQDGVAKRAEQEKLTAEEQVKKQAELEKTRLDQQKQQQQQAAQQLATQQAAERQAATQRAAEQKAAEQRAAEQRTAAEPAAAPERPAPAAAATASPSDLRAVSTPAPRYPPEALRAGTSGEVQVEFTVGTDGSVTAARVVRSNPARVFDREAVNAVRKWRFQPVPGPVTTRRTIGFNPGG
ncbi:MULTISPECIES: energy transducer TonB [unclassified Lysobacter]|uniref:energy transducer TonB n=1 Tax=unclassified Lysobacter TaxID=2635362 RepID=UPI001BEC5883|nr:MULTISPECIES: energy transducer TonB [unclassified Lysobacter]MBT2750160.1 energy transducer TonB [Lysobacter sp. ISL-50]MBT2775269.1 energy transducer TonB [Lysobacter sp. ISL-54]MBT2782642.1 energy transducer TonB [Lysobacter sp. ISL-52]